MKPLVRPLIIEIFIWYSLPVIFLALYTIQFHNPLSSAPQHLYAITLLATITLLLRLTINQLINNNLLILTISTISYSAILFLLFIYYCLVTLGLLSWGKVITEEIILSYAGHIQQLTAATGITFSILLATLTLLYLFFFLACLTAIKAQSREACNFSHSISKPLLSGLMISLAALLGIQLNSFLSLSDLTTKEPFQLTLLSGKPFVTNPLEAAIRFRANTTLDVAEDRARSRYKIKKNLQLKNVVIIVVDALRSDHMGVYGYKRETTPYLSLLRKNGQLTKIDNMHGACAESTCGITSIISSKYAHQFPSNPFTLLQVLKLYGYDLNVILGGDHTNYYNLKDTYGKVDLYFDGSMEKELYMNDDSLVPKKISELPNWNGKPTFFQFHLMSTHPIGTRLDRFKVYSPSKSYLGYSGNTKPEFVNHYDNAVLQTDSIIHEIIALLDKKKYLSNSLVVVTADHGESLGEHQLYYHANSVREELLRIPLLFLNFEKKSFSHTGNRFVSQVDIAPTILFDMNIPLPENWHGKPIQAPLQSSDRPYISYFQLSQYVGLYDYRNSKHLFKYWINTYTDEEFVFDIQADPYENYNLINEKPDNQVAEWRRLSISSKLHF